MIRITQNGFTKGNQRLNNGDLKQVKGFTREGDIRLANCWVVAKEYGNLSHGYCVTSYGSQSKGVDCVFVAESSESFRAADREQFYVSASRFKQSLTIYTDDKRKLLNAICKSSERPSAMDLIKRSFRSLHPIIEMSAARQDPAAPVHEIAETKTQTCERPSTDLEPVLHEMAASESSQQARTQIILSRQRHAITRRFRGIIP